MAAPSLITTIKGRENSKLFVMKETTDPQPHGENFLSVYELYRQLITPEQARHVDRLLREMSTYDENSYPYVHGLLTTLQFRVMANTPMAAAEAICLTLKPFEAKLQAVLKVLEEQSKWCEPRTTAKLVDQKGIIRCILGWPLNQQYKGRLAIFLQESLKDFEEVAAYRARWGCLFCITYILAIGFGFRHISEAQTSRCYQEQSVQFDNWRRQQSEQFDAQRLQSMRDAEAFHNKVTAEAEQRCREEVSAQLQKLEPASYRLAQQFERSSRLVSLADGTRAREVKLGEADGFIESKMDINTFPHRLGILLYLADTADRLPLSATAPASAPIADTNKHRDKRR